MGSVITSPASKVDSVSGGFPVVFDKKRLVWHKAEFSQQAGKVAGRFGRKRIANFADSACCGQFTRKDFIGRHHALSHRLCLQVFPRLQRPRWLKAVASISGFCEVIYHKENTYFQEMSDGVYLRKNCLSG